MSLKYRIDRIAQIKEIWGLNFEHQLITSLSLSESEFENLKRYIKLYILKALEFDYVHDDVSFMNNVESNRSNQKNITPNGAIVPKREYLLEYNLVLREWSAIIKKMLSGKEKLISIFRTTPNIRIKFAKDLESNKERPLNTSYPHSDAWVEGPWGMNCFVPMLGDTDKNTLVYYEPIHEKFTEKMMQPSPSYKDMQWVMKEYRKIDFKPKKKKVYFSDYSMIHNTNRDKNCRSRISIDTTLYVGDHKPHKDRAKEYRDRVPNFGVSEIIDPGQSVNDDVHEKKTTFSHYTSGKMKYIDICES